MHPNAKVRKVYFASNSITYSFLDSGTLRYSKPWPNLISGLSRQWLWMPMRIWQRHQMSPDVARWGYFGFEFKIHSDWNEGKWGSPFVLLLFFAFLIARWSHTSQSPERPGSKEGQQNRRHRRYAYFGNSARLCLWRFLLFFCNTAQYSLAWSCAATGCYLMLYLLFPESISEDSSDSSDSRFVQELRKWDLAKAQWSNNCFGKGNFFRIWSQTTVQHFWGLRLRTLFFASLKRTVVESSKISWSLGDIFDVLFWEGRNWALICTSHLKFLSSAWFCMVELDELRAAFIMFYTRWLASTSLAESRFQKSKERKTREMLRPQMR